VITSAAMIMVSVFLAFVVNGDPTVKQFGLGMAVAVAVDATVVRCVLVPAIMSLLGSSGWWLPKWMESATPKFSIEGNEWFAEHEAPADQTNALKEEPEEHYEPDRAD
jgi:RND superfamily putative drug exporter